MRRLLFVIGLATAACHATTPQAADVADFCGIVCACLGDQVMNCSTQCAMQIRTDIPPECLDCVYEFEHSCAALPGACASSCPSGNTATPLLETLFGGTR